MKKILGAILLASTVIVSMPAAQARDTTISGTSIGSTCFLSVWVPATIVVTTDGRLLQAEKDQRKGDFTPGTVVEFTRSPAVYYQTQKVTEPEHISLVPTACQ